MKAAAITFLKVAALAMLAALSLAKADGLKVSTRSDVTLASVLADAHRLAAREGDTVVRVKGVSMLPYFGDGAVLVVRKTSVESLRAGMVAVYKNRFGETVAHRLEERMEAGWKVRGANNADADSTLVTADNLLGTVYVTLYSSAASDLVADGASAKTLVALAAPAR